MVGEPEVSPICQDGNSRAAGEGLYTGGVKALSHCPSSIRLGGGTRGKQHMRHRNQSGTGGDARPERPVSLAWGKKGLVWRWTQPEPEKGWEVDWSF